MGYYSIRIVLEIKEEGEENPNMNIKEKHREAIHYHWRWKNASHETRQIGSHRNWEGKEAILPYGLRKATNLC